MTLKFCFYARVSCSHHGIKGKRGQLLFATGVVFRVLLHMKTVRECQAPAEVLLKITSVTASEERELPGAQWRGQTNRDFTAGAVCADGSLKAAWKQCMRDCETVRLSNNSDDEPQAVLPHTNWTSQPWHIRGFNPDPKVGYSHLCLGLLRVSSISPEGWGAMWETCCGQSAELPGKGCIASGRTNRSLTGSLKSPLHRWACLSTANGATNLLTRLVLTWRFLLTRDSDQGWCKNH